MENGLVGLGLILHATVLRNGKAPRVGQERIIRIQHSTVFNLVPSSSPSGLLKYVVYQRVSSKK